MDQKNVLIQQQGQQQVQVQTLAPQQVLLAKLTEMPVDALRQRVENECMENPWLEKAGGDSDEAVGTEADSDGSTALDGDGGSVADERVGDYGPRRHPRPPAQWRRCTEPTRERGLPHHALLL